MEPDWIVRHKASPMRGGKPAWYWGRDDGDGWAGPFDTAADAALDMVRTWIGASAEQTGRVN